MEKRQLQKSISDLEAMVLDVNCTNSKLQDENKSLKQRLEKESEKCNELTSHLQPLDDAERALSQRTEETVALKKQLVSLYKFVNECLDCFSFT
jgi:predicted RNase H-like nuclease (RuvC/YqgF family)